ncbi:hypothetical protein Egran_04480 [Elaphomyces granulatus]|uniref:Major facilitator superfamily (MFS) profile domain-containing protein n=1 Tax=Elaphomyces granulatus TaxID=519963 RepID=A0A232LUC7_9EURO|nr:hypothetical protein Egran_04480 [Elaphomyces granulatus]
MVSTQQARLNPADDSFPTTQLFLLAICRVAEPIALTSIFPYSWVMVRDFDVGGKSDAALYAGILVSAFSLAEALTGMFWGGVSDCVGRKPVLLLGCAGTMLSLFVVGLATNYWVALVGRIIGGALNGNIGVIQTMVGELVKRPEHEPRAYAVMPFVWSIGTIIGPGEICPSWDVDGRLTDSAIPAIGGTFAKPTEGYPSIFPPDGLFGRYPFLLPNLICACLLFISIIWGALFLQETNPNLQGRSLPNSYDRLQSETPLIAAAGATANPGVDLRAESYGTFNQVDMYQEEQWRVQPDGSEDLLALTEQKAFTWRVTMLIVALSIFTYHCMTFDHLFPIFLQDENSTSPSVTGHSLFSIPGGLGLSTRIVGFIMSIDGLIALFIQSVIFPPLAGWLGIWKLFVIVTVLHPVAYFISPFIVFLPEELLFTGIYTCLLIRNTLSIIAYPLLLILIKQASPSPSVLGKINGLAASAGAACRTIAPPLSGFLYSAGTQIGCTAIAWWASSGIAAIGAFQLWFIEQKSDTFVTVRAAAPCIAAASSTEGPSHDIVHIIVTEPDYDEDHKP